MSQNAKIATAIIVVIVAAAGIWAFVAMRDNSQMASNSTYQAPSSQTTAQNQTQPPTTNSANTPAPAAVTGNSNASIDQDMAGIDSQMTGLNSDSADVDSSMSQQQAP